MDGARCLMENCTLNTFIADSHFLQREDFHIGVAKESAN